jgi:hypothetical protein
MPIDAGMRLALQQGGDGQSVPDEVCQTCYESLTSDVSQGLKLRLERDQREKNKMIMWKNRVHLVKNARTLMSQKSYSEAAVQYEKYLRVLEVVYNLQRGELSPKVFNNSARSKEMTVLASVYWDLVRIYDTSPRYGERMSGVAQKLSEFLPFSPLYPDIVKQAENLVRTAKNPTVIRQFLNTTKSQRGPCFVASAAFANTPHAVELHWMRRYRDEVLRPHKCGRQLIWLYYKLSPPLARVLERHPKLAFWARRVITKIAYQLKKSLNSP